MVEVIQVNSHHHICGMPQCSTICTVQHSTIQYEFSTSRPTAQLNAYQYTIISQLYTISIGTTGICIRCITLK